MSWTWKFLKNFEDFIRENDLLTPGDRVFVAVSGGVDSVVLLHALISLRQRWQLELQVLHLNHGIRGTESDADENFVRSLAESLDLEYYIRRENVPVLRYREKMGLEEAARVARYRFYEQALQETHFDKVALGHQKNDQAETILENLFRGAGFAGLRGMPVKRGPFIRPLLWVERAEIRRYAEEQGLSFREDASNVDLRFRRNRIRHELLPYLQEHFNSKIVKTLNHLSEVAAETEQFLAVQAKLALEKCLLARNSTKIILDIHRFSNYFNIVQKYIFKDLLLQMGAKESDLTFGKYDALLKLVRGSQKGRRVTITEHLDVLLDHAGLVIEKRQPKATISLNVSIGREVYLPELGVRFQMKRSPKPEKSDLSQKDSNQEWVDFNSLAGKRLKIRTWRPGDKFIPLGMKGFKKISDFLTDEKIPLHRRDRVLILTADGQIVWVVGFRLDDRFKITGKTRETVHLKIEKARENA